MSNTILVIDDDNLVRKSLAQALSQAGFTVEEAADGQEGLAKALALHPDLIVTDLKMPGLDGMAMVEKLRADDWGKQAKVLILSTDETTTSINQAMSAGVTTYLAKTAQSPDEIASQIKQALA